MLILSRKTLKRALLYAIALMMALAALSVLRLADVWIIHRLMPESETPAPWLWTQLGYRPAFAPESTGFSIIADLDALQLTVYKDGDVYKTYPCSGGKKSSPSPLGQWKTTSEGDWGEGFGGSWIAINCPWGKYGIHGTIEPWTIGKTNASHGCIRMLNADVAELKSTIGWGTPVYIKYDGIPFRAMKDGMIGSDVLEVQQHLHERGYLNTPPDGKFGAATSAAVKKFQRDNQLYADGVAGRGTLEKLKEE